MLLRTHRLIFIHVPKTAGNSIQSLLAPFSEDEVLPVDGVDRFEVIGSLTRNKHQTLQEYAESLDVTSYVTATSCRHPVDRLVSFYFSPHRWARGAGDGRIVYETPYWDRDLFLAGPANARGRVPARRRAGSNVPTTSSGSKPCRPPSQASCPSAASRVGGDLQFLNRSKAPSAIVAQVLRDSFVIDLAMANYRGDFDAFGYAHP